MHALGSVPQPAAKTPRALQRQRGPVRAHPREGVYAAHPNRALPRLGCQHAHSGPAADRQCTYALGRERPLPFSQVMRVVWVKVRPARRIARARARVSGPPPSVVAAAASRKWRHAELRPPSPAPADVGAGGRGLRRPSPGDAGDAGRGMVRPRCSGMETAHPRTPPQVRERASADSFAAKTRLRQLDVRARREPRKRGCSPGRRTRREEQRARRAVPRGSLAPSAPSGACMDGARRSATRGGPSPRA